MISEEALEEYKKMYKDEFGTDITDEEAMEQATSLLTMMNAIYRPIKREWLKEFAVMMRIVRNSVNKLVKCVKML